MKLNQNEKKKKCYQVLKHVFEWDILYVVLALHIVLFFCQPNSSG